MPPIERTIAAATHGRYLVEPAAAPAPLLAGFHGYGESAAVHLERLRAIHGAGDWTIVSIQGLHRFYQRRTNEVVASWMTREDRELAIADNCRYVAAAVDSVWTSHACMVGVVCAGFSQGVAMAFRAASIIRQPILGAIAVGGDVPPELSLTRLAAIRRVLLIRGDRDPFYTAEKFAADQKRLRDAGVEVTAVQFEGGHDWSAAVLAAAARFLQALPR